jgi:hypothetical protein
MRTRSIAIVLVMTFAASHAQQTPSESGAVPPNDHGEQGTICVLPNSPEPPTRISPGGMYNPETLAVSVDKGKPILWPHQRSVRIENLTLNERHLIVLTSTASEYSPSGSGFLPKNHSSVSSLMDIRECN